MNRVWGELIGPGSRAIRVLENEKIINRNAELSSQEERGSEVRNPAVRNP